MKSLKVTFKGKTYKLKTAVVIGIAVNFLLIIALIITLITRGITKKTEPEVTEEEDTQEVYNAAEGEIKTEEYDGVILQETEDAGQEYIDSTLFLGDSNTARYLVYKNAQGTTFTTKANNIGVVGMGIDAIGTLACLDTSMGRLNMVQAVKALQPQRIIITMGTNNLYGKDTDATSFIQRYETQLKKIAEAYPSADLIVGSIHPVSRNSTYTNVHMVQIDAYNKAILEMCEKNDWKFLNSSEALKDKTSGYAKDGYMADDGLHLSQKGLQALFDYIRTHAWITEDDRPKPLAALPTVYGVPSGLIQTNPLSGTEFKEDPAQLTEEEQKTEEPQKAVYNLTITCKDTDDNVISTNVRQLEAGETYQPPVISGYTLTKGTSGTMPASDTSITFIYTKEAAHEHVYTDTITVQPSCTAQGQMQRVCSCGDTIVVTLDVIGHNYVNGTCSMCGGADPNAVQTPVETPETPADPVQPDPTPQEPVQEETVSGNETVEQQAVTE